MNNFPEYHEIKQLFLNKANKYAYYLLGNSIPDSPEHHFHELKVGSQLKYEGAFGISRSFLGKIHPKLQDYTPCHYAVYIGDGKIIHFTGGHNTINFREAKIVEDSLENFHLSAKKKGSPVFIYNNPEADSPDIIQRRCQEVLGKKGYDIFNNNCEHIANYCITGNRICSQKNKILKDILTGSMNFIFNK